MPRGIFCSLPPRPDLTCLGGKADHQSPRHLLGDLGVGDTVWGTEVHVAQQPHDPGSVLPVPQSLLLQGLRDFAPDCCLSTPAPLLSPSTPGQLPFLPAPPASPSHLTICPPTHTPPWLGASRVPLLLLPAWEPSRFPFPHWSRVLAVPPAATFLFMGLPGDLLCGVPTLCAPSLQSTPEALLLAGSFECVASPSQRSQ